MRAKGSRNTNSYAALGTIFRIVSVFKEAGNNFFIYFSLSKGSLKPSTPFAHVQKVLFYFISLQKIIL
jgi:hypothetical protein